MYNVRVHPNSALLYERDFRRYGITMNNGSISLDVDRIEERLKMAIEFSPKLFFLRYTQRIYMSEYRYLILRYLSL